jgi:hypothetical protein
VASESSGRIKDESAYLAGAGTVLADRAPAAWPAIASGLSRAAHGFELIRQGTPAATQIPSPVVALKYAHLYERLVFMPRSISSQGACLSLFPKASG